MVLCRTGRAHNSSSTNGHMQMVLSHLWYAACSFAAPFLRCCYVVLYPPAHQAALSCSRNFVVQCSVFELYSLPPARVEALFHVVFLSDHVNCRRSLRRQLYRKVCVCVCVCVCVVCDVVWCGVLWCGVVWCGVVWCVCVCVCVCLSRIWARSCPVVTGALVLAPCECLLTTHSYYYVFLLTCLCLPLKSRGPFPPNGLFRLLRM